MSLDIGKKDEGSEQHIAVEKIIAHPEYDHETVDYDIALIKLQQHIDMENQILKMQNFILRAKLLFVLI